MLKGVGFKFQVSSFKFELITEKGSYNLPGSINR